MADTVSGIFGSGNKICTLFSYCLEKIYITHRYISRLREKSKRHDNFLIKKEYYENCAKELLNILCNITSDHKCALVKNESDTINKMFAIIDAVRDLQLELSSLPSYDAPIEIYRYLRIFDKDGIASFDDTKIKFALYPDTKRSGLAIFINTPLEEFEQGALQACYQQVYGSSAIPTVQESPTVYHITIPPEEMEFPLYWPLLAHEVGHKVHIKHLGNRPNTITAALTEFMGSSDSSDNIANCFKKLHSKLNISDRLIWTQEKVLEHWLTECWCDIYGYFASGPAFIFAQRNSFLSKPGHSYDVGTESHPPYYLRLLVLLAIAATHQDSFFQNSGTKFDPLATELANLLLHGEDDICDDIFDTAQWFHNFFHHYFKMQEKSVANLNEHIAKLKTQLNAFELSSLEGLIERLANGYPIPSIRINEKTLEERATSVHEIMMASWYTHETTIQQNILDTFCRCFDQFMNGNSVSRWQLFTSKLTPIFDRFNESILRSLQMSEWVSLLRNPDSQSSQDENDDLENAVDNYPESILVDHQIKEILSSDRLKILPIIDINTQLGSTSLDVRLGTTFLTYQPNQSGVVDFTVDDSVDNVSRNSTIIDLDFMDSIVLAPGQFVLAHTFEYIGLPDNIAAQLEGRSSFARLGVQIHMTASFIDPGFHGSVTFEIYNAGPNPIRLFPGYRIGQLRFFPSKKPNKPYNKKKKAKYKGLLTHASSMLRGDYEVDCFKKAIMLLKTLPEKVNEP